MQLDHINISAPAELLSKEKDFLCNVFAVEAGFRPNFSRPGYWLYHGENALFHLVESDAHGPAELPGYLDHVAFSMSDLEAFIAKLQHLDVQYHVQYQSQLDLSQVFFRTPTGTRLEVIFRNEQQN